MASRAVTIFIDFYHSGYGKAVSHSEKLAGEVRPGHVAICRLDALATPPPSTLIGLDESFLFIVKLFDELIHLVLRKVILLINLVFQHILEP